MKYLQKILPIFFILIIFVNLLSVLIPNRGKYLTFDYGKRFNGLEEVYNNSQYVKQNVKNWIPDDTVYAYVGGVYLKGISPILLNPEVPPLGKYLIGLSIALFNNENIVNLLSGLMALLMLYLIGRQIYRKKLTAFLPVVFITADPLIKNQFATTPLLDLMQMTFLLSAFYFYNLGLTRKKSLTPFVIAGIFAGAFISTKFFITGATIFASFLTVPLLLKTWSKFKESLVILPVSFAVLVLSYFKYFLLGYNLREFLGVQKWIYLYHKSKLLYPLSVWPLLFFNKWYVWWGDKPIISDPQWTLFWPISTVLSLLTIILYLFHKIDRKKELLVIMIWVIYYSVFSSLGQISARYFVIYFPPLYLLSFYLIEQLFVKYVIKEKNKTKGRK